jgi:hypothetical protein
MDTQTEILILANLNSILQTLGLIGTLLIVNILISIYKK